MQNVILERADDLHAAREKFQRPGVERLDPARVDERDGEPFGFQFPGCFFAHFIHIAETENRHVLAMLQHFRLADLEQFGTGLRLCAGAGTARITDRDRAAVVIRHRPEHVDEFVLILRLHVNHVRDMPEVADVEEPVMGRAVVAAQASAIHAERDVQVLQRDIVNDHVVGALHEGRVDGEKRLQPLGRETAGKESGVFFSDPDVIVAVGMLRLKIPEPGAARHRAGDGDDLAVGVGKFA